jgi:hypothetical protein
MTRTALLLAALAGLTTISRAEVKSSECLPLERVGCWYAPEGAPAGAPLLIYLRGHHPAYKAAVPSGQFLASARQAFMAYGLGKTAREKQVVVLVTYRSGLGVTDEDVADLEKEANRTFARTILAAHSGGYVGLGRTLDSGMAPSRVVMLDDFYGAGADGLPQKLQRLIAAGMRCSGFHTPHNKKNYETGYKRAIQCSIDAMDEDDQHNAAVGRCLAGYLDGRSCL